MWHFPIKVYIIRPNVLLQGMRPNAEGEHIFLLICYESGSVFCVSCKLKSMNGSIHVVQKNGSTVAILGLSGAAYEHLLLREEVRLQVANIS